MVIMMGLTSITWPIVIVRLMIVVRLMTIVAGMVMAVVMVAAVARTVVAVIAGTRALVLLGLMSTFIAASVIAVGIYVSKS